MCARHGQDVLRLSSYVAGVLFKMFPILHTFIHFRIVSSHVRSLSAPPVLTSKQAEAPSAAATKKRKRKRRQKVDADAIAIDEFAKERIREQWRFLATRLCKHSQQTARLDFDLREHQLTLPTKLFLDVAFYAFQGDSAKALLKLFQIGVLTLPTEEEIYICCSRRQLREKHCPINKLIEQSKQVLESARKGHFAILFNNAIMLSLQWNPDLTVSAVIQKVMQAVYPRGGHGDAIAMHRNTTLREGKLSENGLRAGCTISVFPV